MPEYLIGIDGGATSTNGVLMNNDGKILSSSSTDGTNLSISQIQAPDLLLTLIHNLIKDTGIPLKDIAAVGLGLAGASYEDGRELVFKAFDKINLSNRLLISSDAEAAFRVNCPANAGIMISIGTGIICIGRDEEGNSFRSGGLGHAEDKGSGYWIGDQILWQLSLSQSVSYSDAEIKEILDVIFNITGKDNLESSLKKLTNSEKRIPETAKIAKRICDLASQNNQMALNILQEATREAAEYVLEIRDLMRLNTEEILLAGNGSLLRNSFYRKNLSTALEFDFNKIIWTFSDLQPEVGSALLAAEFAGIELSIQDILNHVGTNA